MVTIGPMDIPGLVVTDEDADAVPGPVLHTEPDLADYPADESVPLGDLRISPGAQYPAVTGRLPDPVDVRVRGADFWTSTRYSLAPGGDAQRIVQASDKLRARVRIRTDDKHGKVYIGTDPGLASSSMGWPLDPTDSNGNAQTGSSIELTTQTDVWAYCPSSVANPMAIVVLGEYEYVR